MTKQGLRRFSRDSTDYRKTRFWLVFEWHDASTVGDMMQMECTDMTEGLNECKRLCILNRFAGFVLSNGRAYFKQGTRENLVNQRVYTYVATATLYVAPSPCFDKRFRYKLKIKDPEILSIACEEKDGPPFMNRRQSNADNRLIGINQLSDDETDQSLNGTQPDKISWIKDIKSFFTRG